MILSVGCEMAGAVEVTTLGPLVAVAAIRARAAGLTPALPKTWARAALRRPLPRRMPLGLEEMICCRNALRYG